jgi:hypothetical protein
VTGEECTQLGESGEILTMASLDAFPFIEGTPLCFSDGGGGGEALKPFLPILNQLNGYTVRQELTDTGTGNEVCVECSWM